MKVLKFIVVIFLMTSSTLLWSQDLHFSQYTMAPLSLNPAFTGFQEGNLRANLNYRNQWFTVSSFSTYAFSADANIIRDNLDYDMLGVGLSFFHDIEEKNGYSNTSISLSTAYNVKLSEKPLQYLGFGVQPSLVKKQINLMDAVYGTLFETGSNTDPLGFNEYGGFKFDINMGLSYYVYFNKKHIISTGFTMSHITEPNFGLVGIDNLYRKYTLYFLSEFEAGIAGLAWIKPSLYFTKQGPSLEFMPGVAARVQFYNASKEVFIGFGTAIRMVGHDESKLKPTDFIGNVNLTYEFLTIGFSYDMAISDLKSATGRNGGPEISLIADLKFEKGARRRYFKMMRF
ncbi:MAG: PorP/SprF family type IX secretion system membrane protein [Chitinophagales bacterium]